MIQILRYDLFHGFRTVVSLILETTDVIFYIFSGVKRNLFSRFLLAFPSILYA